MVEASTVYQGVSGASRALCARARTRAREAEIEVKMKVKVKVKVKVRPRAEPTTGTRDRAGRGWAWGSVQNAPITLRAVGARPLLDLPDAALALGPRRSRRTLVLGLRRVPRDPGEVRSTERRAAPAVEASARPGGIEGGVRATILQGTSSRAHADGPVSYNLPENRRADARPALRPVVLKGPRSLPATFSGPFVP